MFVAAEFSLTTVERGDAGARRRGRRARCRGALKAVKRLTFQLSGAQLGITVTSLVIGMLAEPSLAALLRGPLEAAGLRTAPPGPWPLVLGVPLVDGGADGGR